MAQPTAYERIFNFTNYQSQSPASPLPGNQVDAELNAVKNSLDETQANLALIQRDDGALKNASVGLDQLKAEVSTGINAPTVWATLTNYVKNDTVTNGGSFYRCLVSHVSGTFATDLAAAKWTLIVDFTSAISSTSIASAIHGAASKAVPIDADEIGGVDSADSYSIRRFTWANIKATMFAAIGVLLAAGTAKTTPVDADNIVLADSAASDATKKLSWANLKATISAALGVQIAALTGKATPVDADNFVIGDSAASDASKKLTWANLKATLFAALGALIAAGTGKTTPADADTLLLSDSASSDATKKVTWANIKATLDVYFKSLGSVAIGTAGQSLRVNSGATALEYQRAWETISGSGDFTAQSQLDFTSLSAFVRFRISLFATVSVDGATISLRTRTGGAADTGAADYDIYYIYSQNGGVPADVGPTTGSSVSFNVSGIGNASEEATHITAEIERFNKASYAWARFTVSETATDGTQSISSGEFRRRSSAARDGIILAVSSGTMSGTTLVEGMRG